MFQKLFSGDAKGGGPRKSLGRNESMMGGRRKSEAPPYVPVPKRTLEPCNLEAFDVGAILGTGSFGRVPIARHLATGTVVAIKMLSKSQILKTKQVMHIKAERDILGMVNFPFLVQLYGCFQDAQCLYLVLEYIVGGEFFTHLRIVGRFS